MSTRVLGPGRRRRIHRRRRAVALLAFALLAGGAALVSGHEQPRPPAHVPRTVAQTPLSTGAAALAGGTAPAPLAVSLDGARDPIGVSFARPPRSGLLFDVDTGRVLWRHEPARVLPVASLTKMMTALVAIERIPPRAKVRITRAAIDVGGSKVGMFKPGRRIGVTTMLYGLMLPSGNDAAVALAQRASPDGTVAGFVTLMNARARAMGLVCTHFSSPDGLSDRDNHSCAPDLAAIGRAVLREPRLANIVGHRQAVLPFPIRGGRLYLFNHNPLLRARYPGTTGIKTGYTNAAGRCIVATAFRGGVRLGVVLLHSPDPARQATQLLNRGFAFARTHG